MCSNVILIPALNPDSNLLSYVEELINADFENIIVVDDGSDKKHQFVFETFVSCGAHDDILTSNMPHIGTDILVEVIKNLRNKIISLGNSWRE